MQVLLVCYFLAKILVIDDPGGPIKFMFCGLVEICQEVRQPLRVLHGHCSCVNDNRRHIVNLATAKRQSVAVC